MMTVGTYLPQTLATIDTWAHANKVASQRSSR
jgi:hypothetical protein